NVAAFGITRTAKKRPKATAFQLHRLIAELTNFRLCRCLAARALGAVGAVGTGLRLSIARRVAVQALEIFTEATPLQHHSLRFALETNFISRLLGVLDVFGVLGELDQVA